MAIQTPKPYITYQQDILAALQQTGITQTSPGGKARAYADIVASKLSELETRQFANVNQTLLPYAEDDALDFIGAMYGLSRIPRSDVATSAGDNTFTFYVQSGTFGAINNGNDIVIPAGTKLFSGGNIPVSYSVTFQTTLPASSTSQSVSAVSDITGSGGNAPVGTVSQHNFTNYLQNNYGTLLVTNSYGIVTGRDEEDDDSYRYRIQLKLQSVGGASESDILGKILVVPGVQNVSFEQLPGTFNVYVYTISTTPSAAVIQLVQAVLDEFTAFPIKGTAIAPDSIGISLVTTVKLIASADLTTKQNALNNAQAAVSAYVNNLGINGTFVINNLVNVIMTSDPAIVDIGLPDKPIEELYIWRSRDDGTRYSRNLVQNYTLALGERLVVENITTPINFITVT